MQLHCIIVFPDSQSKCIFLLLIILHLTALTFGTDSWKCTTELSRVCGHGTTRICTEESTGEIWIYCHRIDTLIFKCASSKEICIKVSTGLKELPAVSRTQPIIIYYRSKLLQSPISNGYNGYMVNNNNKTKFATLAQRRSHLFKIKSSLIFSIYPTLDTVCPRSPVHIYLDTWH